MRDECRYYFEDEDRYKCRKGHRCHCRYGEDCPDFETHEEHDRKEKTDE